MPLEHASWVLPALEHAAGNPEQVKSAWEKIAAYLLGKKSIIAITGMPGVGKSVLLEYLTGAAYERGHSLPLQPSLSTEEGRILARKKRIRLVTIPGQETGYRFEAASRLFEGKTPLSGVVHVVANGYATLRSKAGKAALVKTGVESVEQYREFMKKEEISDLQRTCDLVQRAVLKHHKPIWMIVAVMKSDLFSDATSDAESYYSPYGSSEFAKALDHLAESVGSIHFNWDSLPVCGVLENMEWNGHTIESKLKEAQRDELITLLLRKVEGYCAT